MLTITVPNLEKAIGKLEQLNQDIDFQKSVLFRDIGTDLASDVQRRIATQNDGQWEGLSKWSMAKKNAPQPLFGAGEYVKWRSFPDRVEIYGDMPEEWTLTQHHEGFDNQTKGSEVFDGKIVIDIVNPGPLGLGSDAQTFAWSPTGRIAHTPARQIWPDEKIATAKVNDISFQWLKAVVAKALGEGGSNG